MLAAEAICAAASAGYFATRNAPLRGTANLMRVDPSGIRIRATLYPDFTQELPRKLLPTRAKERQSHLRQNR